MTVKDHEGDVRSRDTEPVIFSPSLHLLYSSIGSLEIIRLFMNAKIVVEEYL